MNLRASDRRIEAIESLVTRWREDPAQMLADLSKDDQIEAMSALTHIVYGADTTLGRRALKAQDLIDDMAAKRVDAAEEAAIPDLEQAA